MSFNTSKKRAQDHSRHINSRRVAVRSCIQLCLHYSGLNSYQSIVEYYNQAESLNADSLTSENIDKILTELADLREKSKQLRKEYFNYRREKKRQGQRSVSKKDEAIWRESWSRINQLWDKYDTDENRRKKELIYAERRREIESLMKK